MEGRERGVHGRADAAAGGGGADGADGADAAVKKLQRKSPNVPEKMYKTSRKAKTGLKWMILTIDLLIFFQRGILTCDCVFLPLTTKL